MGIEIERKFLLANDSWLKLGHSWQDVDQGYLLNTREKSIRVRVSNGSRSNDFGKFKPGKAWITLKSDLGGIARTEYEYEIPSADGMEMLNTLCVDRIQKRRHMFLHLGHKWEIDVFYGDNKGLVVAEIELQSEDEHFDKPDWLGEEVTDDPRYLNCNLAIVPYTNPNW